MILTDGIHIVSNKSLAELHAFAALIDIKRCWFHSGNHYDIPRKMTIEAVTGAGARFLPARELARQRVK